MKKYDQNYYVYILMNKFNTVIYTGITNSLIRRTSEHKEKLIESFTERYNVIKLVYFEEYNNPTAAIAREKQIKGWSRKKKLELIELENPFFQDLYNKVIQ